MAKYEKPDDTVNVVWARDALSTDFYQPSDEEIRIGWEQEKPPYQIENWSMNKLHLMVAYLNQLGIPEWDRRTEYQQDKSFVQASDGRIYVCRATNRDKNPAEGSNSDYWEPFRGDRPASMQREGVTRYATPAEVDAGSRDDIAVTPYSLNAGRAGSPVGTIIIWPGDREPESYYELNGRALSVSQHPDLFSVLGYKYGGSGDTFRLPDFRGEFVRGWDHGRGIDAGRYLGSSQVGQIQSHNHTATSSSAGNHSHSFSGSDRIRFHYQLSDWADSNYDGRSSGSGTYFTGYAGGYDYKTVSVSGNTSYKGSHSHPVTVDSTGGGETRPRNIAMMYCIKFE